MDDSARDLHIEERPVDSLTPYQRNPRTHSAKQIDRIAASIQEFGFTNPLLVDATGTVIAGHGRLRAAKQLGMATVPTIRLDHLSLIQVRALVIADNKLAELAGWDEDLLALELQAIAEMGAELDLDLDFDLETIGFDDGELARLLQEETEGATDDDAVPSYVEKRCEVGDLWRLGDHRLLCGDATNAKDVHRLMGGDRADAAISDPPYGLGFDYSKHDDSRSEWYALMNAAVPMMRRHAPFVVMPCCGIDRMGWWYENHQPNWLIAWYKGSPGHCSPIGFNDWEAHVVWGKPSKQMHDYFQTECGFDKSLDHPCPKPVAYFEWLCERAVGVHGIVLDLFVGSGTTLIACEKLARRCYGMEIDPHYCDVILQRWERFTERKAKIVEEETKEEKSDGEGTDEAT